MVIEAFMKGGRSCAGVSLVEALVALVVLSVGMLGIAALYVESLRSGRTALARSQAVTLAADMGDRIRANRAGGLNYVKAVDDAGALNANCAQGGGANCAPATMAAHDIAIWYRAVDSRAGAPTSLPGGRGSIAVDNTTTPFTYTITVRWSESGQAADNTYVLRIRA
jgi:type IV pilus assembly protein PilV